MKLHGNLHKELATALIEAFPSSAELTRMVRYQLDETLQEIAGGITLKEMAFNLVSWAEAQDKVSKLVQAARAENPNNKNLASIAQKVEEFIKSQVEADQPNPGSTDRLVQLMGGAPGPAGTAAVPLSQSGVPKSGSTATIPAVPSRPPPAPAPWPNPRPQQEEGSPGRAVLPSIRIPGRLGEYALIAGGLLLIFIALIVLWLTEGLSSPDYGFYGCFFLSIVGGAIVLAFLWQKYRSGGTTRK